MIRDDVELEYEDFIEQYVRKPIMEYTISFSFNGRIYQFDFVNAPQKKDGLHKYYFVSHEGGWETKAQRTLYDSLEKAIESARFEDKFVFKDVYYSDLSDLIDIS